MSLKIEQLAFSYSSIPVLEQVNLQFDTGVAALLGPNAVGKTTLLRCIAGILKARGRIFLDGVDLGRLSRKKTGKLIGYLAQEVSQQVQLTVLEAVLLGRFQTLSWRVSDVDLEITWSVMQQVGIAGLASRSLGELSGGQRQLVSIAQVLVQQPRVLLLDEPTNSLDLRHQLEILALLAKVSRERNIVTVLALHDLNLAARLSRQVVVLHGGHVYASGSPASVLTAETLRNVYSVNARVHVDQDGLPVITLLNPSPGEIEAEIPAFCPVGVPDDVC